MGGSSGGIIVGGHAKIALTDPQVHGQLPSYICALVDNALNKDVSEWTDKDKVHVAHAMSWALVNLP